MTTLEILAKLQAEGYSLAIIAKQSGVPYMRLYRYFNTGAALTDEQRAAIKSFALVQPCFSRGR